VRLSCSGQSSNGSISCRYEPTGLWRRFRNFRGGGVEHIIYLYTEVTPLQCAWSDARPHARRHLLELARQRVPDQPVEIVEPSDASLALRSRSLRVAYVAANGALVQVLLQVPSGISEEDARDFDAVLASVAPERASSSAFRRGQWLDSHQLSEQLRHTVPICGMSQAERGRRALEALRAATLEQPDDWRPWARLGQLLERRAGGRDALSDLLAGEIYERSSRAIWTEPDSDPDSDPAAAHQREALVEAGRCYVEAARREPPAEPPREMFFDTPLDRGTILARAGRVQAKLGETGEARRSYRRVLELGDAATWGYLEASFWLAEDAYRSGRTDEALPLYRTADRAWWAFHEVDWLHSRHGPALRARIDRRLRELGDSE
jgi:tetratricopeptide (TPR) repeat protein